MIYIKSDEDIQTISRGGKILAGIMDELKRKIKPGIKTKELDRLAEESILKSGGKCSFKGYDGFPACLCTSINEEIVHGIPTDRILKEGDIISLDLGIFYEGFHTDMAITVPVRRVGRETLLLIRITKKALKRGIEKAKIGNTFGDISNTIQRYAESYGFNVVRDLCGHGIGKKLHEDPQILNYGEKGSGEKIKEGMVFCIEPMVTMGDWRIKTAKDGYGYQTIDGSLSAHFEHTIAVKKNGPKVLTALK